MDEQPLEFLLGHEVIGRRIRDSDEHRAFDHRNGNIRILVGAFFENRIGAHLSVDRFWANTPGDRAREAKVHELAAICQNENWQPLKGWACARVDRFTKACGVRDAVATPQFGMNPHHADLRKAGWLVIDGSDKPRDKREKALMAALALVDKFDNLTRNGDAEFIPRP